MWRRNKVDFSPLDGDQEGQASSCGEGVLEVIHKMGHVHSKRKKDRRKRTLSDLLMDGVSQGDLHDSQHIAAPGEANSPSNIDRLSHSSGYCSDEPTPVGPERTMVSVATQSDSPTAEHRTRLKEPEVDLDHEGALTGKLYGYKTFSVEDHPALTKLQNEQNARLENMEQRMAKIRTRAMQALERKKFAYLFRAKKEEGRTEKLLQEAREILNKTKEEQKHFQCNSVNNNNNNNNDDYKGEVIPVKIVTKEEKQEMEKEESYLHLSTFQSLNLSDPVMLLLLPFILPLFIIVAVIRGLSQTFGWQKQTPLKHKRRNS